MKITYDEGEDGFIVPMYRHKPDTILRENNRKIVVKNPAEIILLKFLSREDYREFVMEEGLGYKEMEGRLLTVAEALETIAYKEITTIKEETYVPRLSRYQANEQQILDIKEKVEDARRAKHPILPVDPVVNGNGMEAGGAPGGNGPQIAAFDPENVPEIGGNRVGIGNVHIANWGNWGVERNEQAEPQEVPALPAENIYYQRGNDGNGGFNREALERAAQQIRDMHLALVPENDPNRVIPRQ